MEPFVKLETAVAGVRGGVESLATESVALQTVVDTLRDHADASESSFRAIIPAAFEDDAIPALRTAAMARPRKRRGTPAVVRLIEQLRIVLTGGSKPEQLIEKQAAGQFQQANSARPGP
jgi:hypothetical protein